MLLFGNRMRQSNIKFKVFICERERGEEESSSKYRFDDAKRPRAHSDLYLGERGEYAKGSRVVVHVQGTEQAI